MNGTILSDCINLKHISFQCNNEGRRGYLSPQPSITIPAKIITAHAARPPESVALCTAPLELPVPVLVLALELELEVESEVEVEVTFSTAVNAIKQISRQQSLIRYTSKSRHQTLHLPASVSLKLP
jgi:hypothetical protein